MAWTLEKTMLRGGTYLGLLSYPGHAKQPVPSLRAEHDGRALPLEITAIEGTVNQHQVSVTLPTSLLSEGIQIVTIQAEDTPEPLASFPLIVGDATPDDVTAEIALMRAELEMLKRAFRRRMAAQD